MLAFAALFLRQRKTTQVPKKDVPASSRYVYRLIRNQQNIEECDDVLSTPGILQCKGIAY